MSETTPLVEWVPEACTLPTPERPLRLAEFDELFASSVRSVDRLDTAALRLELEPEAGVAARTADLMVRETGCCSFFTFTLSATGGTAGTGGMVHLDITVPPVHVEVLDALAARAAAGSRS
jgi:hypothetical protein